MTKRKALEKLFTAQLPVELGGDRFGIVQSGDPAFLSLAADGYAETAMISHGSPPMIITGWSLTAAGHLAYCMEATPSDRGGA